mmetsp:Transcript_8360/g.52123  ORF Transcript_8360/g.52123 Transcript_8360/m.52123 type:complete len:372 (-) Transcript_8360:130-1245(-)
MMDAAEDQFDAGTSHAMAKLFAMRGGRKEHVVRDTRLVYADIGWHLDFHVLQELGHHLVALCVDDEVCSFVFRCRLQVHDHQFPSVRLHLLWQITDGSDSKAGAHANYQISLFSVVYRGIQFIIWQCVFPIQDVVGESPSTCIAFPPGVLKSHGPHFEISQVHLVALFASFGEAVPVQFGQLFLVDTCPCVYTCKCAIYPFRFCQRRRPGHLGGFVRTSVLTVDVLRSHVVYASHFDEVCDGEVRQARLGKSKLHVAGRHGFSTLLFGPDALWSAEVRDATRRGHARTCVHHHVLGVGPPTCQRLALGRPSLHVFVHFWIAQCAAQVLATRQALRIAQRHGRLHVDVTLVSSSPQHSQKQLHQPSMLCASV